MNRYDSARVLRLFVQQSISSFQPPTPANGCCHRRPAAPCWLPPTPLAAATTPAARLPRTSSCRTPFCRGAKPTTFCETNHLLFHVCILCVVRAMGGDFVAIQGLSQLGGSSPTRPKQHATSARLSATPSDESALVPSRPPPAVSTSCAWCATRWTQCKTGAWPSSWSPATCAATRGPPGRKAPSATASAATLTRPRPTKTRTCCRRRVARLPAERCFAAACLAAACLAAEWRRHALLSRTPRMGGDPTLQVLCALCLSVALRQP